MHYTHARQKKDNPFVRLISRRHTHTHTHCSSASCTVRCCCCCCSFTTTCLDMMQPLDPDSSAA